MAGLIPAIPDSHLPMTGSPAHLPAPPEVALSDLKGLLWRQRWVMGASLVLVVGLVALYTAWTRPVFEASSMLRFEHEQVNLPQLVEQLITENRVSTELEVLQGRSAASVVIDSLGLRAELESPRRGQITSLFPTLHVDARADTATLIFQADGDSGYAAWRNGDHRNAVYARFGDPIIINGVTLALSPAAIATPNLRLHIISADAALKRFQKALQVTRPARDADLIQVRIEANDPEIAARAANLLAEHLIRSRQAELQYRTGLAVNFLHTQVDTLRTQLRSAEDSLQRFRERAKAVDPAEQAKTQVGRMAQLEAERGGLDAERGALAAVMQKIQLEEVASPGGPSPYRRLIGFPSLLKNQAAGELLGTLDHLENERSALLRRRTWQDTDVQALTVRIAELDQQLKDIATTYLEGITSQVAGLDRVAHQFGRALDSLPRKEIQVARLERETGVLTALYSSMQTRLKEEEVTQAMQDPSVRIVDRAYAADEPLRPRPAINLAISLVLGTVLGLTVSLGREVSDRSVRSRADVLHASGLPVLGAFPRVPGHFGGAMRRFKGKAKPRAMGRVTGINAMGRPASGAFGAPASEEAAELAQRLVLQADTPGPYAEAFNQLQTNLGLSFQEDPLKVLVFTSPLPGEGKSLTAINYALTAAARGKNVLLIDADTRCGIINQVFGCTRQPGLTDLLADKVRFEDAVRGVVVNRTTSFALLPTGGLLTGASRELTLERLKAVISVLRNQFDVVVIDSPPVNMLADAALLGSVSDGVILVARARQTRREALAFAMDQLIAARAPVIGTLLNDIDLEHAQYDDGSYKYLAGVEQYRAVHA